MQPAIIHKKYFTLLDILAMMKLKTFVILIAAPIFIPDMDAQASTWDISDVPSSTYHFSGKGEQSRVEHDLDISADNYTLTSLDAAASLSITDSRIDVSSTSNRNAIEITANSTNSAGLYADDLTTIGAGIMVSGGSAEVSIEDSDIGAINSLDTSTSLNIYGSDAEESNQVSIVNSRLESEAYIQVDGDSTLEVKNSEIDEGIYSLTSGEEKNNDVYISNSTIKTDNGTDPINIQSSYGQVSAVLDNVNVERTPVNEFTTPDVQLFSLDGSSLSLVNSTLEYGVSSYSGSGGDASVSIVNSQLGTAPSTQNYVAVAQIGSGVYSGGEGEGKASLSVSDSDIEGNISAQAQNEGGAVVTLSDGSVINGNVKLVGSSMSLNITGAQLNGNLTVGSYNDNPVYTSGTQTEVSLNDTLFQGNITATDAEVNDDLVLDVNDGAMIGGSAINQAMAITGFENVGININYLDPSLINTNKLSYFYFDQGENVVVSSGISGSSELAPLRSGSYILDDVKYIASDESVQQSADLEGKTYAVGFYTDAKPDSSDIAADIQASQAGLLASENMIHQVVKSITTQLDSQHVSTLSSSRGNHFWADSLTESGDRQAGQTQYRNNVSGAQFGGDFGGDLANDTYLSLGAAMGYLHNNLNLHTETGGNNINGNYYSLYANWYRPEEEPGQWHLFSDAVITYGDLRYDSSGDDNGITGGGSYNGKSWLSQIRVGSQASLNDNIWLQPYLTIGYDSVRTDAYNDGYSQLSGAHQNASFAGIGGKTGMNYALSQGQILGPYLHFSYLQQIHSQTDFHTTDYSFSGQNINGSDIGTGVNISMNQHWSVTADINKFLGHDVNSEFSANIGVTYQ
ncbi:autotransporter outer membrane beta-barrel domain-containing protein [Rahnella contaminans]|uniref:autotransporter outer membrane beta-barrel domain-containing protein n=1 Tax=Rahnella contaminans TaxID=2703882 RepID=UPI003C2F05A3